MTVMLGSFPSSTQRCVSVELVQLCGATVAPRLLPPRPVLAVLEAVDSTALAVEVEVMPVDVVGPMSSTGE